MEDRNHSETMVLPELSRTMAYTTRNTVNRLACKKLYLNHVVSNIELEKQKLDQIYANNIRTSRQLYSFLKVKLRRLRRKTYEGKYDIRDKNLHTVLACGFNQTAGPGVTIYDASKQHVHGKFLILSRKQLLGDISCIRNEPKQCINKW